METLVSTMPTQGIPGPPPARGRGTYALALRRGDAPVTAYLSLADHTDFPTLAGKAAGYFSAPELAEFRALDSSYRKYSFLLGRYAAKLSLARYLGEPRASGIQISTGIFKQPIVSYPVRRVPALTMSHSSKFAAAIAYDPDIVMGIDVEDRDPAKAAIFAREITSRERRMALACGDTGDTGDGAMPALLWTMKEAMSKAINCWQAAPFELLELNSLELISPARFRAGFANFGQYACLGWMLPEAVLSIVLPRDIALASDPGILADFPGPPGGG